MQDCFSFVVGIIRFACPKEPQFFKKKLFFLSIKVFQMNDIDLICHYYVPTITIHRKRTDIVKNSFSYIGSQIWQEVPLEIISLSFQSFKKKFKKQLSNMYQ